MNNLLDLGSDFNEKNLCLQFFLKCQFIPSPQDLWFALSLKEGIDIRRRPLCL